MRILLTPETSERLEKLATYLESLPPDYKHFHMGMWLGHKSEDEEEIHEHPKVTDESYVNDPQKVINYCGTVACAAGHGPAAGIIPPEYVLKNLDSDRVSWCFWYDYSRWLVSGNGNLHIYLFSEDWEDFDNTHYGAAARIRYVLDKAELPEDIAGLDSYGKEEMEDLVAQYKPYMKKVEDAQS